MNVQLVRGMEDGAQLEFVRPIGGGLTLIVGLVICAVGVLLTVAGAILMMKKAPGTGGYFSASLMLAFDAWLLASMFHWIRDFHAFGTDYRLSSEGVAVETDGVTRHFAWENFSHGAESKLLRFIRLHGSAIPKPIVLVFGVPGKPRGDPGQRLKLARKVVAAGLGRRFEVRWLFA